MQLISVVALLAIQSFTLAAASDGYTNAKVIKLSTTCAQDCVTSFGSGNIPCVSNADSKCHCYDPANGESCCAGDGHYCRNGYYCAPVVGYCCLNSEDANACAQHNGFTVPAGSMSTSPAGAGSSSSAAAAATSSAAGAATSSGSPLTAPALPSSSSASTQEDSTTSTSPFVLPTTTSSSSTKSTTTTPVVIVVPTTAGVTLSKSGVMPTAVADAGRAVVIGAGAVAGMVVLGGY